MVEFVERHYEIRPSMYRNVPVHPFSFSDGLVDEKYNRNGVYLDKETNTYYYGSPNGVNYFTPPIEKKK